MVITLPMSGQQMRPDATITVAQLDALVDKTCQNIAALDQTLRLVKDLSASLEHPLKQPLKASATRDEILAGRRRAHVSGSPAKIDTDPELRAFIIARISTQTFTQIRDEMRAHFPPDRQTSLSAMSRWWQREGKHLTAQ